MSNNLQKPSRIVDTSPNWRLRFFYAAILVVFLAAPAFLYPVFLMKVLCFGLFACSINLLLGYAGMLSLGQAMFFGGAAYVTAYCIKVLSFPPELALVSGVLFAALLGCAVGLLAIKRQGIYFGMVTLALAQMFYFLCLQSPLTGGEDGLQGVPRGKLFGLISLNSDMTVYYIILGVVVVAFLGVVRIIHSPFGHTLRAMRDNEPRALSLGYNVPRYRLTVFVLSAAIAGLAGSLKVLVFQLASLTDVTWHMSGDVVLMTLVGGLGTLAGPLAGAGIVIGLEHYLSGLGEWVLVLQGVAFVIVVSAFRRGVAGEMQQFGRRFKLGRRTARGSARSVIEQN